MDVTVVVPTRNRSRLLAATLRSVLLQRDVDLEVIVIDEASTDDTPAVVAGFGDTRVRTIRHERPFGVSTARNHGAAEARGEWVVFLDDDDLWAPEKLTRQLSAARHANSHWAYTGSVNLADGWRVVHGRPPLPPDEVVAALPKYNPIPGGGSNVLVRRTTLLRVGPFETRLRSMEDWEMWIRLARLGPPAWVCSPMIAYRVHSSNWSLDIAELVRAARTIEELHDVSIDWGHLHWWMAELCVRQGRRAAAFREYSRAVTGGHPRAAADLLAITRDAVRRRIGLAPADPMSSHADQQWQNQARAWVEDLRLASAATTAS